MKVKHEPPAHIKSVLDERLAHARAHAPGGHLIIDQSDFEIFEPWDRPWNGCPLTALPGGRFIVHPPGYRPRKPRKPSMRSMLAVAEKLGKTITSVTTPDGTTLHFDKSEPVETTALDDWLRKKNAHSA